MNDKIVNGTIKDIDGKPCIYFDGRWIRHYQTHTNTLADKKLMIDQLTRRVFHNVESGINTPGHRVEEVRTIYEQESCPKKKRVIGAMLAGALLNRGRDILKVVVELEEAGVKLETNNELLEQCGQCFVEALELGKNIKLKSGVEGVDELWGEPFRVFSLPAADFFKSRYIKIAQTMTDIDKLTEKLVMVSQQSPLFSVIKDDLIELGEAAKLASETLRSDPVIFEVWPRYVIAKEAVQAFKIDISHVNDVNLRNRYRKGYGLIKEGAELITILSSLRVPAPKSVQELIDKCDAYKL